MHIFSFSRPTVLLLHHGLFALICHASAVLLAARTAPPSTATACVNQYFPMIEHSLISLIALLFGALGLEYLAAEGRK